MGACRGEASRHTRTTPNGHDDTDTRHPGTHARIVALRRAGQQARTHARQMNGGRGCGRGWCSRPGRLEHDIPRHLRHTGGRISRDSSRRHPAPARTDPCSGRARPLRGRGWWRQASGRFFSRPPTLRGKWCRAPRARRSGGRESPARGGFNERMDAPL
jgi:hypothetical protein